MAKNKLAAKTTKTNRTTPRTKKALSIEGIEEAKKGWSKTQWEIYEALKGLSPLQVLSVKHMVRMLIARQNGDLKGAIDHCLLATWASPDMAAVNIQMLAGLKAGDFDDTFLKSCKPGNGK